ncbi:MAG: hypothetical protein ICV75_06720 [Nitrospiraceae bacterium]|nr:hypothetical protein [Nitrospiraceae bacterium]
MTDPSESNPRHSPFDGHTFFTEILRLVLAPLILLFSGFFTANFIISGQYTWPRTSRTLALTLTVLILSYEFVYKEQLSRDVSAAQAKSAVVYSCVIPYVLGILAMVALWKL